MGSGTKEDKKLQSLVLLCKCVPEQRRIRNSQSLVFVVLVGSRAEEDKKLPESGFLVLVGPQQRRIRNFQSLAFLF